MVEVNYGRDNKKLGESRAYSELMVTRRTGDLGANQESLSLSLLTASHSSKIKIQFTQIGNGLSAHLLEDYAS